MIEGYDALKFLDLEGDSLLKTSFNGFHTKFPAVDRSKSHGTCFAPCSEKFGLAELIDMFNTLLPDDKMAVKRGASAVELPVTFWGLMAGKGWPHFNNTLWGNIIVVRSAPVKFISFPMQEALDVVKDLPAPGPGRPLDS